MPKADIELVVLPYSSAEGKSVLDLLVSELASGAWTSFRAAVAFVRGSGNFPQLLNALDSFAAAGNAIALTFGADLFGTATPASDYSAVEGLLHRLAGYPTVRVHLYHEPHRTFHPKMYVLANEDAGRALMLVGSSNWSDGGLLNNVEANVLVRLDFSEPGNRDLFDRAVGYFDTYWSEVEE